MPVLTSLAGVLIILKNHKWSCVDRHPVIQKSTDEAGEYFADATATFTELSEKMGLMKQ